MQYITKGTCSTEINFEIENDKITEISFTGGCSGNLQGICSLVKGMNIDDVISKLEGIKCGYKSTSCPDQLAKALKELKGSR